MMLKRIAVLVIVLAALASATAHAAAASENRPPNVVIVYCDDLGYADIGPFGAKKIATPNLDRMAAEGMKLTSFYSAQAVCSASRAALLTGCYPNRIGILGALGPNSKVGIGNDELTIAEVAKQRGYATAIYGKWHLGDDPKFLPNRHGFDDYFGLPYSNDMWPLNPRARNRYPDLPLLENTTVAKAKVTDEDQNMLTTWYTEHAVKFIAEHKDKPFFVYVPQTMPHVPLHVSEKFRGKSEQGIFGDVVMEIDWSVGQILAALKRSGVDRNTLVVFSSDNGPWLTFGDHAGSAGPLREGKGTAWDGGQREPTIMRWPEKIPAGTECRELCGTIDLLPTIARLIGVELPRDRVIDGKDISPLLFGEANAKSPRESFYFYWGRQLHAVRTGKWKLHFPHPYRSLQGEPGSGGKPGTMIEKQTELALYDLEADVGETKNVAEQHPDVVAKLERLGEAARAELGDTLTGRKGSGVRAAGMRE
jgi:arylsulfatase A